MTSVSDPAAQTTPRPAAPPLAGRLGVRLRDYGRSLGKLGVGPTLSLASAHLARLRRRGRDGRPGPARPLWIKGYRHPTYFRPGTSDLFVIRQMFLNEEYRCVGDEPDVRFIVDCGANIGATAVYLLNRYPEARLIAVEPDPGNAEVCRLNLAPFGDRARVIQAGVWPRDADLKVEAGYRDGLQWSLQVRPCREGETPDARAVGLPTLLAESPVGRIDLLKVDIERAERELFAEGTDAWLPRVRTLVIELHDDECQAVFRRAVEPLGFSTEPCDELTVCRRPVD